MKHTPLIIVVVFLVGISLLIYLTPLCERPSNYLSGNDMAKCILK